MTNQKPATAAWKKAQAYRDMVNADHKVIIAKDYSTVVYLYEVNGSPCAIGYKGRARKPAFNYQYKSIEARTEKINKWMLTLSNSANEKRETATRELEVDDVLCSSWGYDQTNVDYYKVIGLVGSQSVELIKIGSLKDYDGDMSGRCAPDINTLIGESFKKRVSKYNVDSVKIDSFRSARKVNFSEIANTRIYETTYFSSYA